MTDAGQNITTDEHFELFKAESRKWINQLGLQGWQVDYAHGAGDLDDVRAQISYRMGARVATITLAKDWKGDEITEHKVRRSAFHEVCELLLARLSLLALDRFLSDRFQIDEEVHSVIRTLENAVFE